MGFCTGPQKMKQCMKFSISKLIIQMNIYVVK